MNRKSIQILRGSKTYDPATSTEILLDGQPFYSKKTEKLYIGNGVDPLSKLEGTKIGVPIEELCYTEDTSKTIISVNQATGIKFEAEVPEAIRNVTELYAYMDTLINNPLPSNFIPIKNLDWGGILIETAGIGWDPDRGMYALVQIYSNGNHDRLNYVDEFKDDIRFNPGKQPVSQKLLEIEELCYTDKYEDETIFSINAEHDLELSVTIPTIINDISELDAYVRNVTKIDVQDASYHDDVLSSAYIGLYNDSLALFGDRGYGDGVEALAALFSYESAISFKISQRRIPVKEAKADKYIAPVGRTLLSEVKVGDNLKGKTIVFNWEKVNGEYAVDTSDWTVFNMSYDEILPSLIQFSNGFVLGAIYSEYEQMWTYGIDVAGIGESRLRYINFYYDTMPSGAESYTFSDTEDWIVTSVPNSYPQVIENTTFSEPLKTVVDCEYNYNEIQKLKAASGGNSNIDTSNLVTISGDQTITGYKSFTNQISIGSEDHSPNTFVGIYDDMIKGQSSGKPYYLYYPNDGDDGTIATREYVQNALENFECNGEPVIPSNMVTTNTAQTISGQKTLSAKTIFTVNDLALQIKRSAGTVNTGVGANASYRAELSNSSGTKIAGSELRQGGLYISEGGTNNYKKVAYASDLANKADIVNIEEMTLILDPTNTSGTIPKSIIPAGTIGIQKVGKTTGKYGYYAPWSDETGCQFPGSDDSYGPSGESIYPTYKDDSTYTYSINDNLNYYYAVVPAENAGTINCERNHKDILDIKQELNPTYNNSLLSDTLAADPSVWEENGIFYMLATDKSVAESDNYRGDNDPSYGLSTAVFTSTDLVNWKYQYGGDKLYGQNGLATICNFVNSSVTFDCNIWGAQAVKINGEIVIYGCIHNGSGKTAIFAARRTASGYFDNIIKITDSTTEGIWCNDPYVVKDFDGTFYMFFGSRNGIYRLSLGKDGLTKTGSKAYVAGANWNGTGSRPTNCYEGATVFHHGNYWYLLASGGDTVASEGASNAYYVGVARSTSLTGDFENDDGALASAGQPLTTILQSGNGFRNPGHTSNPFVDADGNWYIMYHAITTEGQYGTALYRRPQMLPLKWKTRESGYTWDNINIADAWPYFSDDNKPYTTAKAPKLPISCWVGFDEIAAASGSSTSNGGNTGSSSGSGSDEFKTTFTYDNAEVSFEVTIPALIYSYGELAEWLKKQGYLYISNLDQGLPVVKCQYRGQYVAGCLHTNESASSINIWLESEEYSVAEPYYNVSDYYYFQTFTQDYGNFSGARDLDINDINNGDIVGTDCALYFPTATVDRDFYENYAAIQTGNTLIEFSDGTKLYGKDGLYLRMWYKGNEYTVWSMGGWTDTSREALSPSASRFKIPAGSRVITNNAPGSGWALRECFRVSKVIPVAEDSVFVDQEQTITATKTFVSSGRYEANGSSTLKVQQANSVNSGTEYGDGFIKNKYYGNDYRLQLPTQSGTIALTSDLPEGSNIASVFIKGVGSEYHGALYCSKDIGVSIFSAKAVFDNGINYEIKEVPFHVLSLAANYNVWDEIAYWAYDEACKIDRMPGVSLDSVIIKDTLYIGADWGDASPIQLQYYMDGWKYLYIPGDSFTKVDFYMKLDYSGDIASIWAHITCPNNKDAWNGGKSK